MLATVLSAIGLITVATTFYSLGSKLGEIILLSYCGCVFGFCLGTDLMKRRAQKRNGPQ